MTEPVATFLSGRPTQQIAAELLGKQLCLQTPTTTLKVRITETEAYLGAIDAGAHAYQNHRTDRNQALWSPAGTIYIYQMRAWCLLNIVTQPADVPECVLIRGVEPVAGLATMQANRPVALTRLTDGPGKLMQALGLDKRLNGQRLNQSDLSLDLAAGWQPAHVSQTARIGIVGKGDWSTAPLRYYVTGNPYVSHVSRRSLDFDHRGWM